MAASLLFGGEFPSTSQPPGLDLCPSGACVPYLPRDLREEGCAILDAGLLPATLLLGRSGNGMNIT